MFNLLWRFIFKHNFKIEHREKLSNIKLDDNLENRESPMMPLSYDVFLSVIYIDFSAGGRSFRSFMGCKYGSENSLRGIIWTCLSINGCIL